MDRMIQTDMTCLQIQNIEAKAQSDLEKKNIAISDLERVSEAWGPEQLAI